MQQAASDFKQFFKGLLRFGLILIGVLMGILVFNLLTLHFFQPKVSTSTLVVGDSYMMTSLDPTLLEDCSNISQSAEPYQITYLKLKKILPKADGLERVIVGFSYHNLSSYNDYKFQHPQLRKLLFKRMYALIPFQDILGWEINRLDLWKVALKQMVLLPRLRHDAYIGNFEKRSANLAASRPSDIIKRHYSPRGKAAEISIIQHKYLNKIIDLVVELEKEIYLVATPLHQAYRMAIPYNLQSDFEETKAVFTGRGIPILDFTDFHLPSNHFHDYDHLSYEGAVTFTTTFRRTLF